MNMEPDKPNNAHPLRGRRFCTSFPHLRQPLALPAVIPLPNSMHTGPSSTLRLASYNISTSRINAPSTSTYRSYPRHVRIVTTRSIQPPPHPLGKRQPFPLRRTLPPLYIPLLKPKACPYLCHDVVSPFLAFCRTFVKTLFKCFWVILVGI